MAYYLVTESHGPGWDPTRPRRAQHGFAEHAVLMDALVADGTILLGGPVGEDLDTGDVLLVLCAADEGAVHDALADDPWLGTVLAIKSVQPWSLWLRSSTV